ncbi:YdeI/OmpD-associated family protein [[Pseudopropionibacterium] massiliense]|uniref:YdeI/OmpD-associated family protein n=1 Tax=[Pseudopropionibacterium] massiliense TaxID=2220000 RepID=UPI00103159E7|nr:YdeI/OmpD-associated family protein [[Pseudopropionibacterium] massiliense]
MDTTPIIVPPPLDAALAGDGELLAAWERLPPSHRREWIRSIEDAKRPETKQRRVTQLRDRLLGS